MAQSDDDTMQKMSENYLITDLGEEYVVRGAKVICEAGDKECAFNLPKDHGIKSSDGRPYVASVDNSSSNIEGFGTCRDTGEKCNPELAYWINEDSSESVFIGEDPLDYPKIKVGAYTLCVRNKDKRKVTIKTSGQGSPDGGALGVDDFNNELIESDIDAEVITELKFKENDSSESKDIFCFINVTYSGIYQLKIYSSAGVVDAETALSDMVLYVYHKDGEKMIYDIQFPFTYDGGNKCTTLDWLLLSGTTYYFELDWRGFHQVKLSYRFTGFLSEMEYDSEYIGGSWQLNPNLFHYFINEGFGIGYELMKGQMSYTNDNNGLKIVVLYLSQEGLKDVEFAVSNWATSKDSLEKDSKVLSNTSTAIGGISLVVPAGFSLALSIASFVGAIGSILMEDRSEAKKLQELINNFKSKGEPGNWYRPCKITMYVKFSISGRDNQFSKRYSYIIDEWEEQMSATKISSPLYLKGIMDYSKPRIVSGKTDVNKELELSPANMLIK